MLSARRRVVVSVVSVVALVAGAELAQAQDERSWVTVDIVQVKPEKLSDFEKLYRDEINLALRPAGVLWRSVWQTGEFGETYERQLVTPLANFADFDTGGPLRRVLEPREYDRVIEKLRRSID